MDFKNIEIYEDRVVVKKVENFILAHIFECGQCFRWEKTKENCYIGVAFNKVIEVEKIEDDVVIYNCNEEDFKNIWVDYFDLYRDYAEIKNVLRRDVILHEAVEFGEGIRLLKQEPFETIISFIISSNNRIPMIKRAIERISQKWGKTVLYKGKEYFSFPTIEEIKDATEEDFRKIGVGFRAKYIKNTVSEINSGEADVDYIMALEDELCHKQLQKFSGVGPKVADCIMLFSMRKYSAFPVDVWVKRAMQFFYVAPDVSLLKIREFSINKFGDLAGFAQQYLFYYARENGIKIE
ncbi:DNA-3-methyladenine glycosylase family protein [Clostridium grantii]|uniref:DNA-(apurinic or apyrimidinic site) lyase n=1 Tax=Clostridium grantii DSM 8605 TaxID=1121316 RepID=A0A1M5XF15_9CLOT|nr:DNA-3-methyladenine glycosylase [Clostridium grantii]SHH98410.1 N-glycosylase/DNA lyase [Clostridium grantii DSM 8605]